MSWRLSVCDGRLEMLVSYVLGECRHEDVAASFVEGVEEWVVWDTNVLCELDITVP